MSALTLLLLAPLLARPLGVWEQVQHALEGWLQPPVVTPTVNTSGPVPVRRSAEDGQPEFYRKAMDATIEVLVDDHLNGTGFVVSPGGYAMTAAHVVQGPGRRIEARTRLGRVAAEVVAVDLGHDISLIKLASPGPGVVWSHLELAEAPPVVGTQLFLLGTPIYRHHVVLSGHVARAEPTFEYLPDEQRYVRIMHMSGMSPPGTSGSPCMLSDGRVVGVVSGHMLYEGSFVGVAFIAPLDAMRRLSQRVEDARTPSLGVAVEEIWEQPEHYLRRFPPRTEGLMASLVVPGGPAEAAGLRAEDLITHIDGQRVSERDQLLSFVRAQAPGQVVALTVQRPHEAPVTVRVKLDALETRPQPTNP